MELEIPTIDTVLASHRDALGTDFIGYRNHVYRVAHLCVELCADGSARLEKIAVAAVFHDLGIWTAGTFDYLQPSVRLARRHLEHTGRTAWIPEIEATILGHHKVTRDREHPAWLVEPFRRADWIDVTGGLISGGLSRSVVSRVRGTWPSAGFHWRLVALAASRVRTHPWSPFPMLKL